MADDDNEDRETVADIVREMLDYDGEMESFAVRIETAYRRELSAVLRPSSSVESEVAQ